MDADPTLADTLADHLEMMASVMCDETTCPDMPLDRQSWFVAYMRAAAVRLRKLDAIEEAVGDDLDMLQHPGIYVEDSGGGDDLEALCRRIADALGGTEP